MGEQKRMTIRGIKELNESQYPSNERNTKKQKEHDMESNKDEKMDRVRRKGVYSKTERRAELEGKEN